MHALALGVSVLTCSLNVLWILCLGAYTIFSRHISIRHGSPKGRESINLQTRHILNQRTIPIPNLSLDSITAFIQRSAQ